MIIHQVPTKYTEQTMATPIGNAVTAMESLHHNGYVRLMCVYCLHHESTMDLRGISTTFDRTLVCPKCKVDALAVLTDEENEMSAIDLRNIWTKLHEEYFEGVSVVCLEKPTTDSRLEPHVVPEETQRKLEAEWRVVLAEAGMC